MRANTIANPAQLQQCYQEYEYSPNGQVAWVKDARNNKTAYIYDLYDRLWRTSFPHKTNIGTSDLNDYEEYSYDANDNLVSKRTRAGQTVTYVYDVLNRLTERTVPGSATHAASSGATVSHEYKYDLVGRRKEGIHASVRQVYSHDTAGRLTNVAQVHLAPYSGTLNVGYQLDKAGNLTRLTHPDGWWAQYRYDALNRVERACENVSDAVCASQANPLALVGYDARSRRTTLTTMNGAQVSYTRTLRGDLTAHGFNLPGTSSDFAYTLAYNGAGQLLHHEVSDPLLHWSPAGTGTTAYAANGLNQYTTIAAASLVHDANGNTTKDHRGRDYAYDAENRLLQVRATPGGTVLATFIYNADDTRRYSTDGLNSYYHGDQAILDMDVAGGNNYGLNKKLRRYVRLPGTVDEALLMITYNSSGAETGRQYAHQNRLGSTVAVSNAAGAITERFKYGPYGELGTGSALGFPFRYTGQRLDASTGLYYYKARYYDPDTGRFMQTDPIGYQDQMNLYGYVGNDPVNKTDPHGQVAVPLVPIALALAGGAAVACQPGTQCNDGLADVLNRAGDAVSEAHQSVVAMIVDILIAITDKNSNSYESRSKEPPPLPEAEGRPHSRPGTDDDGNPTGEAGYTTYGPNDPTTGKPTETKQFRPEGGKSHGGLPRPNVKVRPPNTAPDGTTRPGKPEVRPPLPDEIPRK